MQLPAVAGAFIREAAAETWGRTCASGVAREPETRSWSSMTLARSQGKADPRVAVRGFFLKEAQTFSVAARRIESVVAGTNRNGARESYAERTKNRSKEYMNKQYNKKTCPGPPLPAVVRPMSAHVVYCVVLLSQTGEAHGESCRTLAPIRDASYVIGGRFSACGWSTVAEWLGFRRSTAAEGRCVAPVSAELWLTPACASKPAGTLRYVLRTCGPSVLTQCLERVRIRDADKGRPFHCTWRLHVFW